MRVNHAGEIAAQALYNGQSLVARSDATRELLANAAREERDHLGWCAERIEELGGRPPDSACGSRDDRGLPIKQSHR